MGTRHAGHGRHGGIEVERQIGVYRGTRRYRFGEVEVLPVADFLRELHAGGVF